MASFCEALRPVSPTGVQPAASIAFSRPTIDGVAGNFSPCTQTSCRAGSKLNFIAPSSMS